MPYAIAAREPGGPEVLQRIDITLPEPGRGEVLIRQTAVGLNFLDVYMRDGLYPWPVERDFILGSEGAGVVEAVGPRVEGLQPGDRVAYVIQGGGYASHRIVPAARLVKVPDAIPNEVAAAVMLKGLTARYLLQDTVKLQAGDRVLFHAAAGGVGLIAGQWMKHKGVQAIGTAGGPEKGSLARAHGYAEVIDYRKDDFVAAVKDLTGAAGVRVVYDSVGKDTVMGSLDCLQRFGTLVLFGQSSGKPDQFRLTDLARGSLYATRPTLFHFVDRRDWLEAAAADLFGAIEAGHLKIRIDQKWPLDQAAEAHEKLGARATTGSSVLIP
jgi:NADPH:quinone reductase